MKSYIKVKTPENINLILYNRQTMHILINNKEWEKLSDFWTKSAKPELMKNTEGKYD